MDTILEVKHLNKQFRKGARAVEAVSDVSFTLKRGEILGIVGESGCGKSTLARMIACLIKADTGEILVNGRSVQGLTGREKTALYRQVQMVFQMPQESFDPRRTLGESITESLRNARISGRDAGKRLTELLTLVELDSSLADRYPHQVSGGQCQRAAIARALAIRPELLICDEATSALDVTVQAQIVRLLKKLQQTLGLSILLICHDLAMVQTLCDRVLVMEKGRLIEEGEPDTVLGSPQQEYTRTLIESALLVGGSD